MRTFRLIFQTDGRGEGKIVEFDGDGPFAAFAIAEREGVGRHAQLWEGNTHLGDLKLLTSGAWRLTSP